VSRWYHRLVAQYHQHQLHLTAYRAALGYADSFAAFWQSCFTQLGLSGALFFLNQSDVMIP